MPKPIIRIKTVVDENPGRTLDQPQPKKSRARRTYQGGPNVSRRRPGKEADEDEGEAARSYSGAGSSYIKYDIRMERQAAEFAAQHAEAADMLIASRPQQVLQQASWRQLLVDHKQELLSSTLPYFCDRAADEGCCQFSVVGEQEVSYFGVAGIAERLKQPVYECTVHGCSSITAHPLQFSCVPTAPIKNTKLLDVELVEEFRLLQLKDGVGGHGYVDMHRLLGTRLQPNYGDRLRLDDEDLQTAAHLYGQWLAEADKRLQQALGLVLDPLMHCFICQHTLRTHLDDGTPLPAYIIAIMVDATIKAAHFSSAGRSQCGILPRSMTFLGQVARQVLEKYNKGELTSDAQEQHASDCCNSNLTCSRASASARGVVDFAGISGVACTHSFPLLNCFVGMPTPEQHAFHIAAITEALTRRPTIRHIYIDIACRIRGALLAALQELVGGMPSRLPQATVDQLKVMVPLMHAFDHDLGCQIKNSALYQEGVGHRVGEQSEWVWSRCKPVFLLARYMAPARWWDTINSCLALLSKLLQHELPVVLQKRLKNIAKRIDDYAASLEELREEAAEYGVKDLDAALAVVDDSTTQAKASLSKQARYVELLLQLRSQVKLRKQKAGLSLMGSQGLELHAEGSNDKREKRLQEACAKLEADPELNIPLGDRDKWKAGHPGFDAGLQEVATKVCCEEESTIQDLVFKLRVLRAAKADESGNAATKLLRRIIRLRCQIEKHLNKHAEWAAGKDGTAEVSVSTDLLNQVCNGDLPWVEGSANATVTSAQRHFAQRYRHALAQHHRSVEERSILRAEVILLFNGLEEREATIKDWLEEQRSALGGGRAAAATAATAGSVAAGAAGSSGVAEANVGEAGATTSSSAELPSSSAAAEAGVDDRRAAARGNAASRASRPWPAALLSMLVAGKASMLESELSRLQLIHAEASKLLKEFLPESNA